MKEWAEFSKIKKQYIEKTSMKNLNLKMQIYPF